MMVIILCCKSEGKLKIALITCSLPHLVVVEMGIILSAIMPWQGSGGLLELFGTFPTSTPLPKQKNIGMLAKTQTSFRVGVRRYCKQQKNGSKFNFSATNSKKIE